MELKKNQEVIITIDDLGNDGEGIGHADGYALFVKDALPGETVRVKVMKCRKNYGFARLLEILPEEGGAQASYGTGVHGVAAPGVGRVEPRCPVARQCGGCTLQHLSYEKQLAFKEKKVRDCLERIGGVRCGGGAALQEKTAGDGQEEDGTAGEGSGSGRGLAAGRQRKDGGGMAEWFPVMGMEEPWHYRNKAQFPVRMVKGPDGISHPAAGFYAGRTHSIIPVTDCAIQDRCMKDILEAVLEWMKENGIPAYDEERHSGCVRHIYIRRGFHTGEVMVCLVVNEEPEGRRVYDLLTDRLRNMEGVASILLNRNTERTNVILGSGTEILWGRDWIEDCIGGIRYRISPHSFFQVNPVQTEKLYQTVLEFADLSGNETVWDLYCGIGTISLFLAQRAKQVYGVEVVPEAVENARENARINGIENAQFFCGKAEELLPELVQKAGTERVDGLKGVADVVVVDPPRKGCDGILLDTVRKMAPERVVYVSCDSATLARDVRVLGESGYEVRKVRVCDMFPQGGHVETVVLFSHK